MFPERRGQANALGDCVRAFERWQNAFGACQHYRRIKRRLVVVCCIMVWARCFDMFWLIEPNFMDARRNLHFSFGIFEYATVSVSLIAFWMAYYFTQLKTRPLIVTNDPHLAEILEAEHAHA